MLDLKDHLKPNILDPALGPIPGFLSWYDAIKLALTEFLPIDDLPIPDIDDFIIRLLASMSPILGKIVVESEYLDISDACSDASWTYLINMFAYRQMWALQSKSSPNLLKPRTCALFLLHTDTFKILSP